ncbi:hypothetical protein AGDE_14475 [Angomonas deanei]|uniref:Uncharacterized protein n=1 Tax=Angomonas deanei TaxID=59799 RepID=A0A7G2CUI8_9TRYP|nr:hypothetical protein AGDE_14475 [Angomonas deanei]CAD2222731.1 hypothetical protein, conserved [Angomonas deanei]|eukprot:EPY20790.1 hypothetical protein AGDE_14475 [Angomonas deanei]
MPKHIPFVNHTLLLQESVRRRRTFEAIRTGVSRPCIQEVLAKGLSARCASEEVEWAFPEDGSVIEVERTVANSLSTKKSVYLPSGDEYGISSERSTTLNQSLSSVSAGVRGYFLINDNLSLSVEVVVDNRSAAEEQTYLLEVDAVKRNAQTEFEALYGKGKGNKAKDKNSAPPPTLEEFEASLIDAIPKPVKRQIPPPSMNIHLRLRGGAGKGEVLCSFMEESGCVQFGRQSGGHFKVDFPVFVWVNNSLLRTRVDHVERFLFYVDGTCELSCFSATRRCRVLLDSTGGYSTAAEGESGTVFVTSKGVVVLQEEDGRLRVLKELSVVHGNGSALREDGVHRTTEGATHESKLCRDISVIRDGANAQWRFTGFPPVDVVLGNSVALTMDDVWVSFAVAEQKLYLFKDFSFKAFFDLVFYEMHLMTDSRNTGHHVINYALGDLHCFVNDTVHIVSPFGRCAREKNGVLVLPPFFPAAHPERLKRTDEVISAQFLHVLQKGGLNLTLHSLYFHPELSPCPLAFDRSTPTLASCRRDSGVPKRKILFDAGRVYLRWFPRGFVGSANSPVFRRLERRKAVVFPDLRRPHPSKPS